MELNRNHFFMIGLVLLFLGIQFRVVDSYVLNEETSMFIAKRLKDPAPAVTKAKNTFPMFNSLPEPKPPAARRTVKPPNWVGWICVSLGGVMILHSLAMRKPG